ncbi:hypothetical protein ACP275_05G075400 [Erythranthe tilingii]
MEKENNNTDEDVENISKESDNSSKVSDKEILIDYSSVFTNYNTFVTRDALITWARDVGRQNGMVLTIKVSDNGNNRRRRPYVVLACERAGNYRKRIVREGGGKRKRDTGSKKNGCQFRLKGQKLGMIGEQVGWELSVICGVHNHGDFEDMEGHSFAGRLSTHEMALVEDMSKGLVKPKEILATLKQRDKSNATILKTLYNVRHRMKYNEKTGKSQMQFLMGKLVENNYIQWHRSCKKTDEVTDMLWAHPISINLVRNFPYVLIMDCTYKTNRYRLPLLEIVGITSTHKTFSVAFAYLKSERAENYEWALTRLQTIMKGCPMPNAIVTDRDLGLMKAIATIYPTSRHLICRWHINKNLIANCKKLFDDDEMWDSFESEWSILVKQESEELFNSKLATIEIKFSNYPGVLSYIKHTWLDPYKDRFVSAYTDTCMHLGVYTSNRAENSHASLKRQLVSSLGTFSDNWSEIDKLLLLQQTEIKASFQKSKYHYQHCFKFSIYKELRGFVSFFALYKIKEELKKTRGLLSGSFEMPCKCTIRVTHGLPCSHELYDFQMRNVPIPLDCIDSHWRMLSMEPSSRPNLCKHDVSTYDDDIDEICKLLKEKDKEQQRILIAKVREILKPEVNGLVEPSKKVVTKGRPSKKIDKSTRRDPSAFEYQESIKGSCSQKDSMPRNQAKNTPSSSMWSPNVFYSQPSIQKLPVRKPRSTIKMKYIEQIPEFFREYVSQIVDVIGDGNCGFRVVASMLGLGQENWPKIRVELLEELHKNYDIYMKMHKNHDHVEQLAKSLQNLESPVGSEYWMTLPDMGHFIASRYNIVLHFFSLTQCLTFLPLKSKPVAIELRSEVAMAFVNRNHFVHIILKKNSPVPPVADYWKRYHDELANGWDSAYTSRMDTFKLLIGPNVSITECIDLADD